MSANSQRSKIAPHLTYKELEDLANSLDQIRERIMAGLGAADAQYIYRLIRWQRAMDLFARILIMLGVVTLPDVGLAIASGPLAMSLLVTGTLLLAASKILDNMEIGHNIMHGQWDWMGDDKINSRVWEWDHACPSRQWKHTHNVQHHCWANVMGLDRDVGYGTLRVTDQQRWQPYYLGQPLYFVLLALLFDWAIAIHDVQFDRVAKGRKPWHEARVLWRESLAKIGRQGLKDFLLWPLLAGPWFFVVLIANIVANILRNLWTFIVIFCGHFPEQVRVFSQDLVASETHGEWYARQIMASSNISGGPKLHLATGNLSFQIEHHLFPDMPSHCYQRIAPEVEALCEKYGLPYNRGSLSRQFASATTSIMRLTLPDKAPMRESRAS